ncbi:MAG: hypothetical protein KKH83_04835 [Candidatus Margulisbacteria bacterium]|nr:hypothetical protein [Candidatus Margulisiibacteriota bacterium]
MKKILFLNNGHGEDLVAAKLIRSLHAPGSINVLPFVGDGKLFEKLGVKVLGPRKALPGGGFSLRKLSSLPADIFSGYLSNTIKTFSTLKACRGKYDLVVAIGDIVPLIGALITKCPFLFVGVNKSDYYHWHGYRYTLLEKFLLKKYALKVFPRDEYTHHHLERFGIKSEYVGNPLMDCVHMSPHVSTSPRIGFLPGTRTRDVGLNIDDFIEVAAEIKSRLPQAKFLIATQAAIPAGFKQESFDNVLAQSSIVVGLSGTGNEQAAGCGIPVVSFPGRGSQYTKRFAIAQSHLLGPAISVVKRDPKAVAHEIEMILNDRTRYEIMSQEGQQRMGGPGAIGKIANEIRSI